ncbi:MAG: GHKL domain-containing protein [Colwellia sp.]|nr:GHKL domain-containing protein [Colwellia sp.]
MESEQSNKLPTMSALSLEQWLNRVLFSVNFILLFLMLLSTWFISQSLLLVVTTFIFILPFLAFISEKIKNKLIQPYFGLLTSLESIKVDDYSFETIPVFSQGVSAQLFHEVGSLAHLLRQKKRLFDEKDILVHSLIKQLDSPVLLINEQNKLVYGNQALSNWLNKDWRLVRLMPIKSFGLSQFENEWCFDEKEQAQRFKIRSSSFKDHSGQHHLLMLTDISSELRKMQSQSWQQVVRVLSHEIKNTLTPIQSLAQTLAQFSQVPDQKEALEVIVERSQNLTEFVQQYSQMTQIYSLNLKEIDLQISLSKMCLLHPDLAFKTTLEVSHITADPILFEQVLINLISNAKQASVLQSKEREKITISFHSYQLAGFTMIEIGDNGSGIQNSENLFVPFYTTKTNGQGIGLVLCRNIIEQHGGQLTLVNKVNEKGAKACIKIPNK